jgi:hypothetical protein
MELWFAWSVLSETRAVTNCHCREVNLVATVFSSNLYCVYRMHCDLSVGRVSQATVRVESKLDEQLDLTPVKWTDRYSTPKLRLFVSPKLITFTIGTALTLSL